MSICRICGLEANTQKLYVRTRDNTKRSWVAIGGVCSECIAHTDTPQLTTVDPIADTTINIPIHDTTTTPTTHTTAAHTTHNKIKKDFCSAYNHDKHICRVCSKAMARGRDCHK